MSERHNSAYVLIVDDNLKNSQLLGTILREREYQVNVAQSGKQALGAVADRIPDLILLDVMMPEMDGYETCRRLKAETRTEGIPVIFLTGNVDTDDIVKGFELGAVDYVTKPFNATELLRRVETHLELSKLQKDLGREVVERTAELQQAYKQLEYRVKELEARDRLMHLQQMPEVSMPQAYEGILSAVEEALNVQQVILYQPCGTGEQLEVKATLGLAGPGILQSDTRLDEIPAIQVGDETAPIALTYVDGKPRSDDSGDAVVPIIYQQKILGVLWVKNLASAAAQGDTLLNTLWHLGQEAALVLRSAQVSADLDAGEIEIDKLLSMGGE
jgi:DNA-binding response OmpR family regulator